ncbi:MAG: hypothetical protein ABI175_21195 [Polyangiales bacterium]
MSGAVCPKCGVAVVPGYVKCPKCQSALSVRSRAITNMGGTAVGGGGVPVLPLVVGGAIALGIVLFFALKKDKPAVAETPAEDAQVETDQGGSAQVRVDPTALPNDLPAVQGSGGPDPTEAVSALDRALKKERLWGTVAAVGGRVDVRTGGCNDPGMALVLAAAAPQLKDAGLTRLRCMEQSGAVVFERDL